MKRGFTLVELLIVIVIIGLLAALLLPALSQAMCNGRYGAAKHLIGQLTQTCKMYQLEKNAFPKGSGSGSAEMVDALSASTSKNKPYFEFQDDMVDAPPKGNVRSPIRPTSQIIYYRNNGDVEKSKLPADAKNKTAVDLWCSDCKETGGVQNKDCNNWE